MHISQCLHPKLIRNPYTHELQYVPCGHCAACINFKAVNWVERLNQECSCWKYVLFFTLTYDNQHLPLLHVLGDCVYDPDDSRHASDRPRVSFNCFHEGFSKADLAYVKKMSKVGIPYLSHYDAQCFMKRLRINLQRKCLKNNINAEESFLRFYLVGEYGPKNFRPHFHCLLFFNSDFTSSCIQSLLSESWTFGYINSSFVKNSASSYVARYLNCVSHLPAVLNHHEIRPFAHYSKCPPIGSYVVTDQTLRELFASSSPTMLLFHSDKRKFVDVPIWRHVEDRLFPKCPRFNRLSHSDRVTLYRTSVEALAQSEGDFIDWCGHQFYKSQTVYTLLKFISDDFTLLSPLYRLYYISRAVWTQSSLFGVSIDTYVTHIENYYKNCDYEKLKKQYEFQVDYLDNGKPVTDLVWFDRFWLRDVFEHTKFLLFSQVDKITLMQLESFGIDIKKFFSSDLTEREEYFNSLSLFRCGDYLDLKINQEKILKDSTKTKKKNDENNSCDLITNSEIYEQFVSRFETED